MEWMLLPLKRYAQFSGRSRRKEYWMYVLFTIIAGSILGVLDNLLGLNYGPSNGIRNNGALGSIFSLATLVPSIAVAVRRLHDTDRSGWWLFLPVVAVVALVIVGIGTAMSGTGFGAFGIGFFAAIAITGVSGIVLLVFFCLDGTPGPNRFGEDPKGVAYDGVFD